MDVVRTCAGQNVKFYRDAPTLSPIRWYRVQPGGPVLPFCHSFMQQITREVPPRDDPEPDGVGVVVSSSAYDKGAAPLLFRPNGHFIGTAEQWADGSLVESHPNLDWSTAALGASRQCLDGLALGGDVAWWRAVDVIPDIDGRVSLVPDHSGYGHHLIGAGNSRPTILPDDDGFTAIGFLGLVFAPLHEAPSRLGVTSPPPLGPFTLYAVASGFVGTGHHLPGLAIESPHGLLPYLLPAVGPAVLEYRGPDATTAYPVALAGSRHLYRLVRGDDFVSLAVDGCTVMRAGFARGAALHPSLLAYTGPNEVPVGTTYVGSIAALYEAVFLPFAVEDGEASDRTWTDGLISGYQISRGVCDVPEIGSIIGYAGVSTPAGYLECNGSAASRVTYAELFVRLGTVWGPGDGVSTFNLPDLRGRVPRGAGGGPGLTPVALADLGGSEGGALSAGQLPAHTHAVNDPGHAHGLTDPQHAHMDQSATGFVSNVLGGSLGLAPGSGDGVAASPTAYSLTGASVDPAATGISVDPAGANDPVPTIPPFAGVRFLIYAGA